MGERETGTGGESEASMPGEAAGTAPGAGRKMSTRKKVVLWMSIMLLALLLVAGLVGGLYAWRFLKAAGALTVNDVDVSSLPDGTYCGSYSVFHVKAAVEVSVENGRIVEIGLLETGRITEEAERDILVIFDDVVSEQSLGVDVTSGASVTKKVSLKAVEEALTTGD